MVEQHTVVWKSRPLWWCIGYYTNYDRMLV